MLDKLYYLILSLILGCAIIIAWQAVARAEVYDAEVIADGIYHIEGAERAKKPFGILSVSCNGYADCRRVCINTIQNNFTRWQIAGSKGDFLTFLAGRYAPLNVENDPAGLNANWLRNLKAYLK